jgi:hypothetical protein
VKLAGLAFLLAACGSSAPAPSEPIENRDPSPPEAPAPSVVGSYQASHDIEVVCSDPSGWCTEHVADTLIVRDAGDGALDVEIELIQTNAHSCSFSGTLALVEPGVWRFHSDEDAEDGACTLTLTAIATELTIAAEGCRYYCGMRASLDATFPR